MSSCSFFCSFCFFNVEITSIKYKLLNIHKVVCYNNIKLFIILHIILHHILFVILEVTTTPIINPDTGTINYVVNENDGNVTVCLMKDLVTAVDFTVTFIAREKTPPDATCKISENRYYIQHNYNEILYV